MKSIDNIGLFTSSAEKTKASRQKGYLAELNADCDSLSDSVESTGKLEANEINSLEAFLVQEGKIQFQKSGFSTELDSNFHESSPSSEGLESVKESKSSQKGRKYCKMQVESTSNSKTKVVKDSSTIMIEEAISSQKGSRRWQEKLCSMKSGEISKLIKTTDIAKLMLSRYGNYFCQVMFERCNQKQISWIIAKIEADLCQLAKETHGTHSLQKLISLIRNEKGQKTAVSCLEPYFLELALV